MLSQFSLTIIYNLIQSTFKKVACGKHLLICLFLPKGLPGSRLVFASGQSARDSGHCSGPHQCCPRRVTPPGPCRRPHRLCQVCVVYVVLDIRRRHI